LLIVPINDNVNPPLPFDDEIAEYAKFLPLKYGI
jgi:hypothetical protein